MRFTLRHLAILDGALALLLALLLVLVQLTAEDPPPPTPEPGELLYVTTFDAFNDEWDLYRGRKSAQVTDGMLQVHIEEETAGVFSPLDRVYGDFDLTVEASHLEGPIDNGFGVIFRHRDADNFYQFLISSDGYYKIVQVHEGAAETLTAEWAPSEHIRTGEGAANTLRVVARGSRFTFHINGQQQTLCLGSNAIPRTCEGGEQAETLNDSTLDYGHVGVGALTTRTGGPGVAIGFDNLVITGPE